MDRHDELLLSPLPSPLLSLLVLLVVEVAVDVLPWVVERIPVLVIVVLVLVLMGLVSVPLVVVLLERLELLPPPSLGGPFGAASAVALAVAMSPIGWSVGPPSIFEKGPGATEASPALDPPPASTGNTPPSP